MGRLASDVKCGRDVGPAGALSRARVDGLLDPSTDDQAQSLQRSKRDELTPLATIDAACIHACREPGERSVCPSLDGPGGLGNLSPFPLLGDASLGRFGVNPGRRG